MVERVPQHRHCSNCDKAIPYKEKFCDETCEGEYKGRIKTKKRQLMYFYAAMIAVFVISISLVFLG